MELDKCPGCKSWCCTIDMSSCRGHPVSIPAIPHPPYSKVILDVDVDLLIACAQSTRVHLPKRGSCMACKLPGWRRCQGRCCFWSDNAVICPECTSGGMTCVPERKCGHATFTRSMTEASSSPVCAAAGRSAPLTPIFINASGVAVRLSATTALKKGQMRTTVSKKCRMKNADDRNLETMFAKFAATCDGCGEITARQFNLRGFHAQGLAIKARRKMQPHQLWVTQSASVSGQGEMSFEAAGGSLESSF
ncbi:uncharacterized protein EDB91DRAFT_1082228 [Suillus paluster]|uniref:uncharacterized protein n=1 Tax=Suillus paluster TaxID=48578 RepID=UPI001B8700EF|nr:uncharacterized protein EDB91DRAFT_1082228 [Suillus paluster]KAG1739845.1 hypothetical protein EDB91DRAFT_1082228 [Suillus paluster]